MGEVLALRASALDFERKIIRVRQSLDSATRKVQARKSNASSADVPMPPQLETLLRHTANRQSDADLLFVDRQGRPYFRKQATGETASRAAETVGHSAWGASTQHGTEQPVRCWQMALHLPWCRSRCAIQMPESHWEFKVTWSVMCTRSSGRNMALCRCFSPHRSAARTIRVLRLLYAIPTCGRARRSTLPA